MDALALSGERLHVPERMIVAPTVGVFRTLPPETVTAEGELVEEGQTIGMLDGPRTRTPVLSPFRGFLMGMLASEGERLRPGQPVAWLRETG
jgi:biotin carboxyl carrier protein